MWSSPHRVGDDAGNTGWVGIRLGRYPRRVWRIEIRLETGDSAVRQRVSEDVAGWQQLSGVSISVTEEESGSGQQRVRTAASTSVTASLMRSKFAEPSDRRRQPPRHVRLDDLPGAVPFQVFTLAGLPNPDSAWIREGDDDAAAVTVTMTYTVMEDGWHVGNIWLRLASRPFADSPMESWRQEGEFPVCEEHAATHYRYKLRLQRLGTYVHIESTGHEPLGDVLELAERLEPLGP